MAPEYAEGFSEIVHRPGLFHILKEGKKMSGYMIFSGTSNPELAEEIATYLEMPLSKAKINRFSDGEISVQIAESVRVKMSLLYSPPRLPPMQT